MCVPVWLLKAIRELFVTPLSARVRTNSNSNGGSPGQSGIWGCIGTVTSKTGMLCLLRFPLAKYMPSRGFFLELFVAAAV